MDVPTLIRARGLTKAYAEAEDVAGSIRTILDAGEPPDGPKKT